VGHPLGGLALLHPFPSVLNAVLVLALALLAGGSPVTAVTLACAMLAFQVSIGALNDLVDLPHDRVTKPWKPIAAGRVSIGAARRVVVTGGSLGVVLAATVGPLALATGIGGYACGVAYDVALKRRGLGSIAYALAFPLLLLFAWTGAGGGLPPGWATLLPVAAVAGPALQLSNGLIDLEHDRSTGSRGLAASLGPSRGVALLAALVALVHALAWLTLLASSPPPAVGMVAAVASGLAVAGVAGSASATERRRAWGWTLQAVSIALLGVAWIAGSIAG
jgi:4-hydroxybenzoate polyprenyltransferase